MEKQKHSTYNKLLWLFWSFLGFFLGVVPSIFFLIWTEQNSSYTILFPTQSLPLLNLKLDSLIFKSIFNLALIFCFGFFHSLLAQNEVQKQLYPFIPERFFRKFYIFVTGMSLFAVTLYWQNTNIELWSIFTHSNTNKIGSFILLWSIFSIPVLLLKHFNALEFLGLTSIKESGPVKLIQEGIYKYIRHPIYTFTLLAILTTPVMTLDRMLIFFGFFLYLTLGIPIEEKKLISLFGKPYLKYKQNTPALFPRFFKKH